MDAIGIHRVVLLGRVGKYGVSLRHQGSDCASFLLTIPECGRDGQIYTTRIPVEIWGKHAQDAKTLAPRQLVLVEGRLRKRKRPDDEWEVGMSSWEATPVGPAVAGADPRQGMLV
jgi:single-stranded DNA-binding protein